MTIGGISFGAPSRVELDAILASARAAVPSYRYVGATLEDVSAIPRHDESIHVGRGSEDFAAARDALSTWVPQRRIGAEIIPPDETVAAGVTLLLVLRRGPACAVARNRVVGVIDEPNRFAYAYGTLPGHPERGEEAFVLDHLDDDSVQLTIRLAAGPSTLVGRALTPLVRWITHAALRRYLVAVVEHVNAARSTR